MARFHRLDRIGPNLWVAVIHAPVPEGKNSSGVEWSDAIVAAGLNVTVLAPGAGLTMEEYDLIRAGKVIEGRIDWAPDTGLDVGFVEEHIAKAGADGIAEGAVGSVQVVRKVRDEFGREVRSKDNPDLAEVTRTTQLTYTRGKDSKLDAIIDLKRAAAVSAYLDREIIDLLARVMDQLDQPMMVIE